MKKDSKIYIAGHRGLVGSAILRNLKKAGYSNIVCKTRAELDLMDAEAVNIFFNEEKPEYVFLSAAKVGGIKANEDFPADFIYQNIQIQNNIIHNSYKTKIKKLLFLGVGGLVGFLIASMYLKSRKERVNTKNRYGASPFNMTKIKKSIKGGHKERDKDKLSETSLKKMMALGNKLIRDVKTKLNPPSVSGFQTLKYPDKKSYNAEYVKRYRALKPKMSKKSREILDAVEKKAEKKRPNDIDYLSGKLMYAIWEGRWD